LLQHIPIMGYVLDNWRGDIAIAHSAHAYAHTLFCPKYFERHMHHVAHAPDIGRAAAHYGRSWDP
jgi:hypothetical protein